MKFQNWWLCPVLLLWQQSIVSVGGQRVNVIRRPPSHTNNGQNLPGSGFLNFFSSPMEYLGSMVSNTFSFARNDEEPQENLRSRRRPFIRPTRAVGPPFFGPPFPGNGPRRPFFESNRLPPGLHGRNAGFKEEGKGFWTGSLKSHFRMIELNDDSKGPIIHKEEAKEGDNFLERLQHKEQEEQRQQALLDQHEQKLKQLASLAPLNQFPFSLEPINTRHHRSPLTPLPFSANSPLTAVPFSPNSPLTPVSFSANSPLTAVPFRASDALPSQFIDADEANAIKQWEEWGRLVGRSPQNNKRHHNRRKVSHPTRENSVFQREVSHLTRGNSVFKREVPSLTRGSPLFNRETPPVRKTNEDIKKEVRKQLYDVNNVADALQIVVDALHHTEDGEKIYLARDGIPISAASLPFVPSLSGSQGTKSGKDFVEVDSEHFFYTPLSTLGRGA